MDLGLAPILPLTIYIIVGKSGTFSEPQFSQLQNRKNKIYLVELF